MSLATTLEDLFKPALRIAGVTHLPNFVPSADQYSELVPAVNRMMGSWNCDGHKIFTTSIDEYPLVDGQKIYTIGPVGADFLAPRPICIIEANLIYPTSPQVRRPIRILTDDQWSKIAVQDIHGAPVAVLYYDGSYIAPNGLARIYIEPQPPAGYILELYTWTALKDTFTAITDAVVLPPGYDEAIATNMAIRICQLHHLPIDSDMRDQAQRALKTLMVLNSECPALEADPAITWGGGPYGGTNFFFTGGGGGMSSGITWLTPAETPDGVTTDFNFAQTPVWVSYNGANLFVGVGYQLSGVKTIQLLDSVGAILTPQVGDSIKAAAVS